MWLHSDLPNYVKYIIIFLGTVLAVLGLFVDKTSPRFKYIAPVFILIVLALGGIQAIDSIKSDTDAKLAEERMNKLLTLADTSTLVALKNSAYLTDLFLSFPKILKDFGLSEERAGKPLDSLSIRELEKSQIIEANRYRTVLIEKKPISTRSGTRIWYYNKEMDSPELKSALSELGFAVENKIATQNQKNDKTNAVWFGSGVELDDYKAVIVSLIRAGIDVKRTGPSCNNLSTKKGVIEIGASDLASGATTGMAKPSKSIEIIKNAKSFTDIQDFSCQS